MAWTGGVLAVLAAVAAGGAWWTLSTEAGTRWAFRTAHVLSRGAVDVGAVHGRIRSPLELDDVTLRTGTLTVTVKRLSLDWRLRALLSRRLDIGRVEADDIRIVSTAPSKGGPTELPDVHLPVNVIVRDAVVRRVQMTSPGAAPFVVDSIDLKTQATGDTVHVERLAVRSRELDLDAEGSVTPNGAYPVDLRVRWSATRPDGKTYRGHGSFTGTLEKLDVTHELEAPVGARLAAHLKRPLRDLEFDGDVTVDRVRARDVDPAWPDAVLGGRVHARGRAAAFTAEGNFDALAKEIDHVSAGFQLDRRGDEWTLRRLDLRVPERPASLTVEGRVTLGGEAPRFDLNGEWKQLAWPLAGKPAARSPHGKLAVRGTARDYTLEMETDVAGGSIPPGRWTLRGRGDERHLTLASLEGALLGGTLTGSGSVGWRPDVTWDVALAAEGIDPGREWADYPGRIALSAVSKGRMAKDGPVASVEVSKLRGALRGQPLSGSTLVDVDGERTVVRRFDLRSGSAQVTASGEIGKQLGLTWGVKAPNVGAVVSDAAGSLTASGSVNGPRAAPRVRASVQGESLALGSRRVARLTGNADLDLRRDGLVQLTVNASGIAFEDRSIDKVSIAGSGTRSHHRITLSALAGGKGAKKGKKSQDSLDVALDGGLDGKSWRGTLTRLDLTSPETGTWRLDAPARLAAGPDLLDLKGLSWSSADARLAANASWRKSGATTLDARLDRLPLSLLEPFLPANTSIIGTLDGKATVEAGASGSLAADVEVKPSPGEIRYPASDGRVAVVSYHDARLTLKAAGGGVDAKAALALGGSGRIDVDLSVPRGAERAAKDRPLTGHVRAQLPDLGFVQAFARGAEKISGTFGANLTFSGTAASPRVTGEAALRGAGAYLPEYGLSLREVTLVASGRDDRLRLQGSAVSGGGKASLQGEVPLAAGTPSRLDISGDRFEAMHTDGSRVLVSPRLQIVWNGTRVDVTGDMEIPEARMEYEKKFATIPVSRDVVILGARAEPEATVTEIHSRVRVVLGDRVRFKGSGFDARLEGSILAVDEPGKVTAGSGELRLTEGTYKAYGQDLTIEHGRLLFAGPVEDPGLDAQAYRKASDGVVAGIVIKGTLKQPEVTLYSDPAMAQSEALAYVVLGHPLGQSTQKEGSLVANAATSLGLKGGNMLAKKVAARFGLEEARLESKDGFGSTSLVVGKYLSPRFYIQYGIGLFDRVSTLRVNYLVSRKWTIRAETGVGNSADILYTIER